MPSLIQSPSGIFYIVSSQQGKRVWKSTRTRIKKEAYQVFLTTSNEKSPTECKKLSFCIAEYMNFAKTNFARKTQAIYKLSLKHLLEKVGDTHVDEISSLTIEQYKSERANCVKPATVNIELRTIKAFFNRLKQWSIVTKNPCDGVQQIRKPDELPSYLTFDQLRMLLNSIQDPWLKEFVIFASMTGTRLGEVTNLSWDDVSFERKTITIRSSHTYQVKGGKLRIIPMNQSVFELLKTKEPKQGMVFPGKKGGRASAAFVSEKFREAVRNLGFDRRLHFHSLRHTFASLLVTNGTSLYQVQKLLGHSSPKVTEIYAHLQSTEMHHIVAVLNL